MGFTKAVAMPGTYFNTPLAAGKASTCPECLRRIKTLSNGRVANHGWQETGRGTPEYFRGPSCLGYGLRPIEETDADALAAIARKELSRDVYKNELGRVESGARETYSGVLMVPYLLNADGASSPASEYMRALTVRLQSGEFPGLKVDARERNKVDTAAAGYVRVTRTAYFHYTISGPLGVDDSGLSFTSELKALKGAISGSAVEFPGFKAARETEGRRLAAQVVALESMIAQIKSRIFRQKAEDKGNSLNEVNSAGAA